MDNDDLDTVPLCSMAKYYATEKCFNVSSVTNVGQWSKKKSGNIMFLFITGNEHVTKDMIDRVVIRDLSNKSLKIVISQAPLLLSHN